jgi:transcription elongation factor GreB
VVREQPRGDAIYFGAIVELLDGDGDTHTYRIVGPDETDAKTSAISMDSPLAKALLARRVDDEVVINAGGKSREFSVVSIRYAPQQ